MANRPWQPGEDDRKRIRLYAGLGLTQEQIAAIFGKSVETIVKHCRDELDAGKAETIAKVAGTLVNKALKGDTASAIFYLKTQAGWRRFGWYVWDQGPGLPGDWNGRLAPSHEFIFHFNRETLRANKSVASKMAGVVSNGGLREKDGSIGGRSKGPSAIQSHKIHDSVFRVMRHKGGLGKAGKHPAVFPVALVEEAFDAYTKAGDIVFEPFCGSGTQVIAAEKLGRHCFGSEMDPAYVDVAVKRWQEFTGLNAIHEATGKTFAEMSAKETADGIA